MDYTAEENVAIVRRQMFVNFSRCSPESREIGATVEKPSILACAPSMETPPGF